MKKQCSTKGIGVPNKQRPAEREFFCGERCHIYITNPDPECVWDLERSGIYEGWTVLNGVIYLVLKIESGIGTTKLIPASRIIQRSLQKLGGVPSSCYEELKMEKVA